MNKADLRKKYKKLRREIPDPQRLRWSDLLLIQFQNLQIGTPSVMMSYAAIEDAREFDPSFVVAYCNFKNPALQVCYPVINRDDRLAAVLVKDDTSFAEHAFGMEEPVNGEAIDAGIIDLIIVPLLAFDTKGYRVGYGRGYYDGFLAKCRPDAAKVGFSFFGPEEDIAGVHDGDVRLDYCITPQHVYAFR